MPRRAMAVLIVVGLGVGVWMLWPRGDQAGPVTTAPTAAATTSTTAGATSTTTSTVLTTTSTEGVHVVETVEEAEAILRELWFGWFEGIYNQDEDRIREVVATEEQVEAAKESFGVQFERAPEPDDISFAGTEILRSDEECLAVWTSLSLSGFRTGEAGGVEILRTTSVGWQMLSTWALKDDLWEADCESSLDSS